MKPQLSFYRLAAPIQLVQRVLKPPVLLYLFIFILFFNESEAAANSVNSALPPVAVCKSITVQLGIGGTVTISPSSVDAGSYDPDGTIANMTVSPNIFNCSNKGYNTVILTVIDNEGLKSTCSATIAVEDKTAPVINYKPFTLVLGSSGTATLTPSDIDNGTFDNCGGVTLSVSPSTFNCSDLGTKTVVLSAIDSNGNSSSRNVEINVTSTLEISSVSLSTCEMSPTLALFDADIEGGNGNYSYLWKGINPSTRPFMIIIPFPPELQFFNTSILPSPFFNNAMADGYYNIRFVVTDGNGCADSSELSVNKTGAIFNNRTMRNSRSCEGEVMTYSVNHKDDAVYDWSVTNGTILNSDQDTSRIEVRWNQGVAQGIVTTTILQPNILFPDGTCESTVIETVALTPLPSPAFGISVTTTCTNSLNTYTLTNSYTFHNWTVTGGVITAGGSTPDNFITVMWGNGPTGSISVSAGNNSLCTGTALINVSVSSLKGTITSKTDIKCNGSQDGSVTVAATPGTGQSPYEYSLDGGIFQPGGIFSGIAPGNHIVRIRDASTCTFDLPFVISQPDPLSGSVKDLTNISCYGENTGSATIAASGGVAPYFYKLGTGTYQTSGTFGSLAAGNYSVTVRDANLCTFTLSVTIMQPSTVLSGTIEVTNVGCFGEYTGACKLKVTGGTPPYSYLWNNGAVTDNIINIPSGNYSVTVTDALGCKAVVNASVSQPASALNGSITSQSNVTIYGGSDGSVTISGAGGTAPYKYSIDGGAFQSSGTFGSLSAGDHNITLKDASGCLKNLTVKITQPWIPLTAKILAQTNVPCSDGSGGSVTVEGWGGVLPYLYSFEGGEFQSSGTFGSLKAGTYTITVRDVALDLYNLTVTIAEPEALSVSVSGEDIHCFGGNTGSVTVSVSGGTGPYNYSWNSIPVQTGQIATGLTAGTYTVVVTDAGGCTASNAVTISQPATDMSISISQVNVICSGGNTGSATATAEGGLAPYTYSWNTIPVQTKETATDLSAGTYSVTVTDSHGCIKTGSVTITEAQPITINSTVTPTSCPDSKDGSIILTISGGTAPFNVIWSDGFAGQNRSGLTPGSYTAVVTDHKNCGETITIDLEFTFSFNCLIIPQVITPNNDGFNDVWRIRNIDLYPAAEIRVFNRWGKMVFSTRNPSDDPWDGTIGGKIAPTDSYYYIIYLNDGSKPLTGIVSVIR